MRVAIGSDHGGFSLKAAILKRLKERNIEVTDHGSYSTDAVDYPDVAVSVGKDVAEGKADFGILMCRTGIGMSITANKLPGIRAALCDSVDLARLSREHNDANVLTMAGGTSPVKATKIVRVFLETKFSGVDRHRRRVKKIHRLTGL
ncbi:MAG TPA: ribose 5-phosphate isomerase B [bacterium]